MQAYMRHTYVTYMPVLPGVSPVNATYHLGQAVIPLLDHCKDLGIIFSSNLSWSQHYSIISAKAYKQLGLIRRTFSSSVSII